MKTQSSLHKDNQWIYAHIGYLHFWGLQKYNTQYIPQAYFQLIQKGRLDFRSLRLEIWGLLLEPYPQGLYTVFLQIIIILKI